MATPKEQTVPIQGQSAEVAPRPSSNAPTTEQQTATIQPQPTATALRRILNDVETPRQQTVPIQSRPQPTLIAPRPSSNAPTTRQQSAPIQPQPQPIAIAPSSSQARFANILPRPIFAISHHKGMVPTAKRCDRCNKIKSMNEFINPGTNQPGPFIGTCLSCRNRSSTENLRRHVAKAPRIYQHAAAGEERTERMTCRSCKKDKLMAQFINARNPSKVVVTCHDCRHRIKYISAKVKNCGRCEVTKPIEQFVGVRSPDRFVGHCLDCRRRSKKNKSKSKPIQSANNTLPTLSDDNRISNNTATTEQQTTTIQPQPTATALSRILNDVETPKRQTAPIQPGPQPTPIAPSRTLNDVATPRQQTVPIQPQPTAIAPSSSQARFTNILPRPVFTVSARHADLKYTECERCRKTKSMDQFVNLQTAGHFIRRCLDCRVRNKYASMPAEIVPKEKICERCNKTRSMDQFINLRSRGRFSGRCLDCRSRNKNNSKQAAAQIAAALSLSSKDPHG